MTEQNSEANSTSNPQSSDNFDNISKSIDDSESDLVLNLQSGNDLESKEEDASQSKTENIAEKIQKSSDSSDKSSLPKGVEQAKILFNKLLENGFDGITTDPNYKLLALLIILLINLSLFLVLGGLLKNNLIPFLNQ